MERYLGIRYDRYTKKELLIVYDVSGDELNHYTLSGSNVQTRVGQIQRILCFNSVSNRNVAESLNVRGETNVHYQYRHV